MQLGIVTLHGSHLTPESTKLVFVHEVHVEESEHIAQPTIKEEHDEQVESLFRAKPL